MRLKGCDFMLKDDALKQFQTLMEFRNLSPVTLKMYLFYVDKFIDYSQKQNIEDITLEDARSYILQKKSEGLASQSVNVILCGIRYFFETVMNDPLSRRQLPNIRYTVKDPCLFSKEQIVTLVNNATDIRIRLILLLGIDCGFRATEVVNLRVKDIHSDTMTITIRNSKRNKTRIVKMSHACLNTLRKYWCIYKPTDFFFPSRDGKSHKHVAWVHSTFKQYILQFSFYDSAFSYHSLRHTFATNMLENGCDIFLLKKLLGHASFSSTARYIHLTSHDIKNSSCLSDIWGLGL